MNKHENILIVRTDRIGDVVLTTPLIPIIKKKIPEANVFFLANNYTKDLLEKNIDIKETIILQSSFFENYRKIKKFNIDTVLVASPSFRLALLFFLLRISYRVGTGYRWYSFLFNRKQYEHRRYGDKHELEYNINLLQAIGINYDEVYTCQIPILNDDIKKVDDLLSEKGIKNEDKIIIVHPGSGGSAMDFPLEKFRELVQRIDKINGYYICFTGAKNEKGLILDLNDSINNRGMTFIGELNLRELAYLIKRSKLFISNSTGPIHIAAAVGTFIIGFYPPVKAMKVERWGPYTDKRAIFIPDIVGKNGGTNGHDYCVKCLKTECKDYDCMNTIPVDEVFTKINEVLLKNDSI